MTLLIVLLLAQEPRISIDKTGTLEELVEAFRQAGGGNVHLDESCRGLSDKRELILRSARPESVLRWIAALWKIDLQSQDGVPVLASPGRGYVLRNYDLRPIGVLPGDRPGPRFHLSDASGAGIQVDATPQVGASDVRDEMLIDLIKESVAPGTWGGHASIEKAIENRLLVTQSPAAHAQLAWFLDSMAAFATAPVTLTAEFREGDDVPRILAPDQVEAVAETFRGGRRLQTNGLDTQRVHSSVSEKAHGIVGYVKGEPILENWIAGGVVLDARPTLMDAGRRISVELHLSQGGTRALPPAQTGPGPLPLQERAALQLATNLVVPNGGGALIALPGRQVCLLRASSAATPRPAIRRSPPPAEDVDLLQRFAALPPADIDLETGTVADLAAWLRRASGLNVVLEAALASKPVSVRCKAVAPSTILGLALKPLAATVLARDGAILIGGFPLGTSILDVRDISDSPYDFPAETDPPPEGARGSFTGEDIANLIKNTLHKNRWEEADGKSIQYVDGLVFIRNHPDVLQDCAAFIEERRLHVAAQILLRADTVDLDAAAVDKLLGAEDLHDEAVLPKLLAGTVHERLGWIAQEGQRTSMAWSRAVDHVADYDGPDPIRRGRTLHAYLDVRARVPKEGGAVQLEVRYRDPRLLELKDAKIRDLPVKSPVTHDASTTSTLLLTPGKIAVLRWSLPAARQRLLILQVLTK